MSDIGLALAADKKNLLEHLKADTEKTATFFGQSPAETATQYNKLKKIAENPRAMDVRRSLENESVESMAAAAQVEDTLGINRQGSQIKESRQKEAHTYDQEHFEEIQSTEKVAEYSEFYGTSNPARQARRAAYAQHIQNMLDLGYTVEDIKFQIDNRKIWDTFTPHPTKEKNENGRKGLLSIAHSKTAKGIGILKEIVKNPLSPRIKDNLSDETNTGLDVLDEYMDGALDYLEDMQWALDNRLEDESFDIRDTGIDIAPRDWYAGDADGKLVPAEVLFSKRLQGAVRGIEKYIQILDSVPSDERQELQHIAEKFQALAYRLQRIESDPESLKGEALDLAIEQFETAFADGGFSGLEEDIGPNWTGQIMEQLREISDSEMANPSAKAAARRVTLMHKQVGIAIGRQEVRHSGADYNQIFQNVYEYLAENPEVVPDIKIKPGSKLEDLSSEAQLEFYKRFASLEGGKRELLHKANEGKLEGPAAEVLKRFEVLQRTFNKRRMGVAIIAEANEMSCIQQQVMAEAFHINGMTHCALNEDQNTIKNAAKNLRLYLEHFGGNNLKVRMQEMKGEEGNPDLYVCVMDPASDSHKSWGTFMKDAQIQSAGEVAQLGTEFNVAALGKIGTGMSYARGGFPAEMAPRFLLHAMSRVMDLDGLQENARNVLKKQIGLVSLTIQGRGPALLRGRRDQVQDTLAKIGFEMDAAAMAIDGVLDPKDVAPLAVRYSPNMTKLLSEAKQDARDHYHDIIRHDDSKTFLGTVIENNFLKKVSPTMMALLTNVSARKASRDDGDGKVEVLKDKDAGGQRAIGQNVIKEWSESLYDGWYEVGTVLSKVRQARLDNKVTANQVKKLKSDQMFMRHEIGNAVLALSKADLEWGFDMLALDKGEYSEERWTVGMVLDAQANNFEGLDELETRQAQIAYEGLLASSHLEALMNNFADDDSDHEVILSLYNPEATLEKVKFGPKTMKFYKGIKQTQELAKEDKLSRMMVHECERRLREMESRGEHLEEGSEEIQKYRHIAMSRRVASGPITMPNLMDTLGVTFGARKDHVIDFLYKKAEIVRKRTVSNDNSPDPTMESVPA